MDDIEIPPHFICPISLQIMKDPVTVVTGITYDRDSIQRWQAHAQNNNTCPVTNQPLPINSGFTPNHNLRRLIQSWRVSDDSKQVSMKQSLFQVKVMVMNLIKNVKVPDLKVVALERLRKLACESDDEIRVCLKEVGVVRAMISVVVSCYENRSIVGLKEALDVLHVVRFTQDETWLIVSKYDRIIRCLTWVLSLDNHACVDDKSNTSMEELHVIQINKQTYPANSTFIRGDKETACMKLHAIVLLKDILHHAKSLVLERLDLDFFKTIIRVLQHRKINNLEHGIKDLLNVMHTTCTWPRNCSMMIESGAVFELIELELGSPEKGITEVIMAVLVHLCSSADGRAQLLGHAGAIAVITKRITTVSRKVDERALIIVSLISRFSGTDEVVKEMARVGMVEKLCMVLQLNGLHSYTREKAKEILKRHSNVWKDSPCLDVTLLSRYPS
ncbi:hypothetical protein QVD17_29125 [Tagetes erecta]|uniref:U-box domain-containing protein n=1 Tax=Tagetes erecta TaxID=13708 RepID=A0AAD8KBJ5_TARER|nr:hypothetical protein QVD17_29125 [Tagetes erecta]